MVFMLTSCASQPSSSIPQTFNSQLNEGMVIGSIAFKNERPIFNGYMFYYIGENIKKITSSKMISISPEQIVKMKFQPNFFDNDKAVYFFSITEIPGNYSFVTLRLFENGGFVQSSANIPIDIKFNIEKGKVKYLGEIYFDYNKGLIETSDKRDRDLPRLKELYPSLKIE